MVACNSGGRERKKTREEAETAERGRRLVEGWIYQEIVSHTYPNISRGRGLLTTCQSISWHPRARAMGNKKRKQDSDGEEEDFDPSASGSDAQHKKAMKVPPKP